VPHDHARLEHEILHHLEPLAAHRGLQGLKAGGLESTALQSRCLSRHARGHLLILRFERSNLRLIVLSLAEFFAASG
jgi:hypothetical protein